MGHLSIDSVEELREALLHSVQQPSIVLNLSEVESIDTAALQVLLAAQKGLLASGKPFRLDVSSAIAEMAAALGFSFSNSTLNKNSEVEHPHVTPA